jgi:hypothetical protein
MLSADPIVQEPHNAQNLNRYSYVVNNPLSYTDPSGLSFWKKYGRQLIAIGLNYFLPGATWFTNIFGAASRAVVGFVSGAVTTGNIRGAIMGAFTAGMGPKFTAAFGNIGGAVASGIVTGIGQVLQGGKFGHGFASAGIGAAAGPLVGRIANDYVRAAAEIIVGGTASVAAGGKFANGAVTAAFSVALDGLSMQAGGRSTKAASERELDSAETGMCLAIGNWRPLNARELRAVSGMGLDGSGIRIWNKKVWMQPDDTGFVPNDVDIRLGPQAYMDDYSVSAGDMAFLIHEIVHIQQRRANVRLWFPSAKDYNYAPSISGGRALHPEAQAEIYSDLYLMMQGRQARGGRPMGFSADVLRSYVPHPVPAYDVPWRWR